MKTMLKILIVKTISKISSPFTFALIITTVFAISTTTAAFFAVNFQSKELKVRLFKDTQYLAETLASIYENAGVIELTRQIENQTLYDSESAILSSFWDQKSGIIKGNLNVTKPFSGQKILIDGLDLVVEKRDIDEGDGVYYGYGIKCNEGWILVARDSRWLTDSQETLEQSILWGLGIAMLLVSLVVFFIAKRTASQVKSINTILDSVSNGDLNARCMMIQHANKDLYVVSQQINSTLNKLQQSMESLRQISTDIAHDLRRPLTRLRLKLEREVAIRQDGRDSLSSLKSAMTDVDDLANTFDAILRLAQLESGIQKIMQTPINLNDLCMDIFEMFEPIAEESQRNLIFHDFNKILVITGDQRLIQQAVINLIDNSLRHTEPGAKIELSLRVNIDTCSISVCDNGPGISEAEYQNVIRRFYRIDQSRNVEGTGLGLSLVNAIAHRHKADFKLSDNRPGLCAKIIFSI
tara:strand:- start:286 stop:1686 length:1401 start_codon:yes stop_codon:yes gene_type:complete